MIKRLRITFRSTKHAPRIKRTLQIEKVLQERETVADGKVIHECFYKRRDDGGGWTGFFPSIAVELLGNRCLGPW